MRSKTHHWSAVVGAANVNLLHTSFIALDFNKFSAALNLKIWTFKNYHADTGELNVACSEILRISKEYLHPKQRSWRTTNQKSTKIGELWAKLLIFISGS